MFLTKCKLMVIFKHNSTPILIVINVQFQEGLFLTSDQVFFILASFFGVGNIASINRYTILVRCFLSLIKDKQKVRNFIQTCTSNLV